MDPWRDTLAVMKATESPLMNRDGTVSVRFRLDAPGFAVDVHVRSVGERWMAAAEIDGKTDVGIGRTARQALEASLVSLGQRVAAACLQDLALLGPSVEIARQQRASAGSS
jgi:hypothetical protein